MPSAFAISRSRSTVTTSLKWARSTAGRRCGDRSRKRFDVGFARPTRALPAAPGDRASAASSPASLSAYAFTAGVPSVAIQERPAHRVVARDVALADRDLEEVDLRRLRAEHLGARPQVRPPDPPEALVELLRVEEPDLLP